LSTHRSSSVGSSQAFTRATSSSPRPSIAAPRRKNDELYARYEKTREYRSVIAKKGLKTKAINAEQPNSTVEPDGPHA
jgi:hypothetical protein